MNLKLCAICDDFADEYRWNFNMIELRKPALIHLTLILLVVFYVVGCEQGASSPQSANAADKIEASTAGPASTNFKKQRYEDAIEGITFTDDGLIAVESFDDYDLNYAQQRHDDAYDLSQSGYVIDAIKALSDAIRAAPDFAEPYNSLGLTLRLKNKPTEAVAAFNSALLYDEQFADARYNLAMTHWMMGERSIAMQQMQRVLDMQSDYALAYEKLAIWHYYASDDVAAWKFVRGANELDHQMPAQFMTLLRGRTPDPGR